MCLRSFTSFADVPSLVCVEPKYLNWSASSCVCPFICMLVDGLGLMLLPRFPCRIQPSRCFLLSLRKLLQFFFTASEQVDVIGKPQVAKRLPPTETDDSGVSVSSAYSTASSAKLFTDEFTGVRAFCIIFARNILNNTGDN